MLFLIFKENIKGEPSYWLYSMDILNIIFNKYKLSATVCLFFYENI